MTAPTLAIPAPAAQPRTGGGCHPTTIQVWAVWADDFDKRVRVEVQPIGKLGWVAAEMAARVAGSRQLRVKIDDVLARYVVTKEAK